MKSKTIKIIKKKDVAKPRSKAVAENKQSTQSAKEIVANVSTWVNDFQRRKREETKTGFESLFSNARQNVES